MTVARGLRGSMWGCAFASVLAMVVPSRTARADDAACFANAEQGQRLRNAGKLIESERRLIECSRAGSCPDEVLRDCARWLMEVEERMPSAVFGARDEAGRDLLDVRVFLDGSSVGTTSDGRPTPLDPGPHEVRFERAGSRPVAETIVVRAGEKNRPVVVTFSTDRAPGRSPTVDLTSVGVGGDTARAGRRVPLASWILGGAGVVGLGVFGYFGVTGISDYDRFDCGVGCRSQEKQKVDTEFLVADVGLVVGLAALAGATLVYVLQPAPRAATVAATPTR